MHPVTLQLRNMPLVSSYTYLLTYLPATEHSKRTGCHRRPDTRNPDERRATNDLSGKKQKEGPVPKHCSLW